MSRLWFPPPGFFYSVATADVAEAMVLNTELLNVPQGNNSQCIYSTVLWQEVSAKCRSNVNGEKEATEKVKVGTEKKIGKCEK